MRPAGPRKRKRATHAKQVLGSSRRKQTRKPDSLAWIRELAAPYLKGYEPAASEADLQGFWFVADPPSVSRQDRSNAPARQGSNSKDGVGFFVGYLTDAAAEYSFLKPAPPECVIFVWVAPAGSQLHDKLVCQPGSLVRRIFEYIRWLTHRPPRFVFHEAEAAAMARHISMIDWPEEKRQHLSRNFFIETLAWLVRSGLVRKLKEQAGHSESEGK